MSDLTHDLKSVLTNIKAVTGIVLRGLKRNEMSKKEIADYVNKIEKAADRLNELIDKNL